MDIASLLKDKHIEKAKNRSTERGDLLLYFTDKLNRNLRKGDRKWTPSRVAGKLAHLKDWKRDWYFLKSSCEEAESRGVPWGAAFHSSLKSR